MKDINNVKVNGTVNFVSFKESAGGKPWLLCTVKTCASNGYDAYVEFIGFGDVATENKNLQKGDRVDVIGEIMKKKNKKSGEFETVVFALVLKKHVSTSDDSPATPSDDDDIPF